MAKSSKRTPIIEEWQPDERGREFAASLGVPDSQVAAFVDHHMMHGNLMASWPAAWRTWCRNAVRFGAATGTPAPPPLFLASGAADTADPHGARAWGATLREGRNEPYHGHMALIVDGLPIVEIVAEVCQAAGIPEDSRPDLNIVRQWISLKPGNGVWPDDIIAAIRGSRQPDKPNLRYFDSMIRQRAARAA